MPVTFVTLIIGALAASGIFPFAGFWSKDSMFSLVWMLDNKVFYAAAMGITFLSSYYCFRMVFVLGYSEIEPAHGSGHGGEHHGKESPANMWVPLAILGFLSVTVGFLGSPWMNSAFFRYLVGATEEMNYFVVFTSLGAGLLGVGAAFADYARPALARDGFVSFVPPVRTLFVRLYYVDDFYHFIVHKIVLVVSAVLDWFDKTMVNGAVNATGLSTIIGGRLMSRMQTGLVQVYLTVMFIVVVGIVSCFALR
jgi:NADH-quinone oxidoreductase subunit L